jgi:hypothetical protein
MNEDNLLDPLDDSLYVDLLIDGELDDRRRRELLLRLEREPDGWRSCALAFLEAQCWRQQLGGFVSDAAGSSDATLSSSSSIVVGRQPSSRHGWLRNHLGVIVATAASFVAAFALGVTADLLVSPGQNQILAEQSGDSLDDVAVAAGGGDENATSVAARVPSEYVSPDDVSPRMLSLVVDGADPDGAQRISLPLRNASDLPDDWWLNDSSAVTSQLRELLEETGHRVQQRRKLWPFELQDGRQVVVPVDQYEVEPSDYAQYQ